MGAIPCCVICPNPYKAVSQGKVGLITRFGRFYRAVDPGLVKINPLTERLIQIDVKIQIVGTYYIDPSPALSRCAELTFAPFSQRCPNRSA